MEFGIGRIPWVMGVGEAQPAEPVILIGQPFQPGDRTVSHPVGVIDLPGHRVAKHLWCASVTTSVSVDVQCAVQGRVEGRHVFRMVLPHPAPVVHKAPGAMAGELHALKAAVRTALVVARSGDSHAVLGKAQKRIEERFEVRLAEQPSPPPCIV